MRLTTYLQLPFVAALLRCSRILLVLPAFLALQGCAEKQVRVRPWAAAVVIRPNLPAPAVDTQLDSLAAAAPDLSLQLPSLPSPLSLNKQPVRPRVPAQLAPEAAESSKPPAPSLEPELSPQEIAAAQQQLNQSTAVAQKNLDVAKGRSLNPTQADLTSKVTAFLQESKQAVREGDWTRAKNLAKKAEVLSQELAASL
jgi:hypothetical protein